MAGAHLDSHNTRAFAGDVKSPARFISNFFEGLVVGIHGRQTERRHTLAALEHCRCALAQVTDIAAEIERRSDDLGVPADSLETVDRSLSVVEQFLSDRHPSGEALTGLLKTRSLLEEVRQVLVRRFENPSGSIDLPRSSFVEAFAGFDRSARRQFERLNVIKASLI